MATYTLTKIKTFTGMEGQGLNATLCRDGRPVAFVLDDASGGEMSIDFTNPLQNAKSWHDAAPTRKAEELAALAFAAEWLATSPDAEESRQMNKEYGLTSSTPHDALESWINSTVDRIKNKARLDRAAKTKTLFRLHGDNPDEWRTLKVPASHPGAQAYLAKLGDKLATVYGRD